jgi:hypothetical protein
MMMKNLGLACLCLATMACSHDLRLMKMEDTLSGYGSAIRWGLFEKAADFQEPRNRTRPDLGYLKNIHVTAYDPIYRQEQEGSNFLKQTVEIRYYQEQTGVEKTITDRQSWRYDEEKDQWLLMSKLPDFKP